MKFYPGPAILVNKSALGPAIHNRTEREMTAIFVNKNFKNMAKEFMLYIRNAGDAKAALTEQEHLNFIKQCEVYIGHLKANNKLIAAQPITRKGYIVSRPGGNWQSVPIDPSKEVQVGYYHILADNIEEAIDIAKNNPEFAFVPSASIEVRPIKVKEEKTDFVYPK